MTHWQVWETTAADLREVAAEHQHKVDKVDDIELLALLRKREENTENKQELNKINRSIWRRRRALRRERQLERFEEDAAAGRAPKVATAKHYIWTKISGTREPKAMLTEFYEELYGLPAGEKQLAQEARDHWTRIWLILQGDVRDPLVT